MRWKVWSRASSFTAAVCAAGAGRLRRRDAAIGGSRSKGRPVPALPGGLPTGRRERRFGSTTLRIRDRGLTFEGLPNGRPDRVPSRGPRSPSRRTRRSCRRCGRPRRTWWSCSVAWATPPTSRAERCRRSLSLDVPVLILAGGEIAGRVSLTLSRRPARRRPGSSTSRRLDFVRIGADTFLPVAGAYEGRYALGEGGCGYSAQDLEPRSKRLASGRRAPRPGCSPGRRPGDSGARSVRRATRRARRTLRLAAPGRACARVPPAGAGYRSARPPATCSSWSRAGVDRRWSARRCGRAGFALLELGPMAARARDAADGCGAAAGPFACKLSVCARPRSRSSPRSAACTTGRRRI